MVRPVLGGEPCFLPGGSGSRSGEGGLGSLTAGDRLITPQKARRIPMNLQIKPAPVRKTIAVNASPSRAFEVFTSRMIRWWQPEHHIGLSPMKEIVLEPRVGGRCTRSTRTAASASG